MAHIDGEKIELVIEEIYEIFEKNKLTHNEASAIAGMILLASANTTVKETVKETVISIN